MQRFSSSSVATSGVDERALESTDGSQSELVPVMEESGEHPETQPVQVQKGGANRLEALDLMRGFIMIIMSWDHTKDIFASANWKPKHQGQEGWQGPFSSYDNNWWWFIARAVSNVCAPGFFFTMGISMSLFTVARKKSGWSSWSIAKHFIVRGIILLIVGRLVDPPFLLASIAKVLKGEDVETWRGKYGPKNKGVVFRDAWIGIFEVMTGLGLTMMTALLVLFPCYWIYLQQKKRSEDMSPSLSEDLQQGLLGEHSVKSWRQWLKRTLVSGVTFAEVASYLVFISVYAIDNVIIVNAQGNDFFLTKNATFPDFNYHATTVGETFSRFFFIPGSLPSPMGSASYPVFPWLALTSFGIGIGFSMSKDAQATIHRLGLFSALFLTCFFLIRLFGGTFGNYRGLPRNDGQRAEDPVRVDKLLAFFITSKYPPSLAYTCLYLGIDMGVIFGFFQTMELFHPKAEGWDWRVVPDMFRKTCKIFGEVPLFFYIVHFWTLGPLSAIIVLVFTDNYQISLPACVLLWLALLIFLRPLCISYGRFKKTTPKDSWWRYI